MNSNTLFKISYGVYVITSKKENKINGMIATTITQITSEPARISVVINKQNLTHKFISDNKSFNVSILSEKAPFNLIGQFGFKSGRDSNKFEDINIKLSELGNPIILDNSVGFIEAQLENSLDVGTHTIFIGKIINAEILSEENQMTYDYYHKVLKGKSPKTAPTFVK